MLPDDKKADKLPSTEEGSFLRYVPPPEDVVPQWWRDADDDDEDDPDPMEDLEAVL